MLSASSGKYALAWVAAAATIVVGLSLIFGVAYIYSLLGIAALVFGGHFVTLDDDVPGGWSNPESSEKLWHSSIKVALVKLVVLVGLAAPLFVFPGLEQYGAR